jgi:hypothetical protein
MYMLLGVAGDKMKQGIYKIYTAVKNGLTDMCFKIYGVLLIQLTRLVQLITNLFAQLKLNIELCLARYTNQVPLMKLGLMNVLHKVGQLGQQLLIIARKIHQRVLSLLKRGS